MTKDSQEQPAAPMQQEGWLLLIYRVPSEPSKNRVAVWRELKRLGALFLQNCVCVLPNVPQCRKGISSVIKKVKNAGGDHYLFPIGKLDRSRTEELISSFRELSEKDYREIIEECDTKFVREIEFERGRQNFTYEESEEIREDYEKIERWYQRVQKRDWFHSDLRDVAGAKLQGCKALLEEFEEEVYRRITQEPAGTGHQ